MSPIEFRERRLVAVERAIHGPSLATERVGVVQVFHGRAASSIIPNECWRFAARERAARLGPITLEAAWRLHSDRELLVVQTLEKSPELIVVVGPTASGKTALSVALAERLGGEIVSADSVQIYRAFDIGAGKPTDDERRRVPHHLVGAVDPLEHVDAARFAELADRCIADIIDRGKRPIVCGGTFLWIRALLFGLSPTPPGDDAIRARHRDIASTEGREALHARLAEVDRATAERLSPNDFVRVSRALEVAELTGTPLSEWHARHGFREPRYPARLIGVKRTAAELTERIAVRAHAMLAGGWIDEVRALCAAGYGEARAMKSVGYRQIAEAVLRGTLDSPALEGDIVRATRIFARRQRTWLRDEPVEWLAPDVLPSMDSDARSLRA